MQVLEPTTEKVTQAVNAILETLGHPETPLHEQAMTAFKANEHATVKRLAATNLSDYYCKSLGYLGGAMKLTPNTDTILAEAARSAADHVRERALEKLGKAIAEAMQ